MLASVLLVFVRVISLLIIAVFAKTRPHFRADFTMPSGSDKTKSLSA
jgi:hypothetical protein